MVEENGATKRHGTHEIQEAAASQSQKWSLADGSKVIMSEDYILRTQRLHKILPVKHSEQC